MSKGIFEQIKEVETVEVDNVLTKKNIKDFLEKHHASEKRIKKQKDTTAKENREHLEKRAKELGEPIPLLLSCLTNPHLNPELLISRQQYKEYEKWFL